MHIAGLIGLLIAILMLHHVSRRITKPIIQLANATGDVVEGRLDQIKLILPPLKHNDEVAVLCHSFEEMVKGLQEKEKVKGVLNKVVSREIAQEILKGSIHLGGEEKIVTVLFADIRGFTQLTQNMKPNDVVELLNSCMTKISQVVDKNGGVIDKYVGDEAMALFGAPIFCNDAALKAIRSAIEMVDALQQWNKTRVSHSRPVIEIGIGIHTGAMLVGNMGAENRLNYTVIGSNVNLAARLCSAAGKMEILISKDTLAEPFVKDSIKYEEIPLNTFKGFDQPITVYRVLGYP
jgi:adenylate cyclase